MKSKWVSVLSMVVVLMLMAAGAETRAAGGGYAVYLPVVQRGGSWQEVGPGSASAGGISNTPGESGMPAIAIASDGTPYVAWHDPVGGNNSEIYVRTWNGSAWAEVGAGSASGGGISNNVGISSNPAIAIAADGTPCVAWVDKSSGNPNIYVRSWNGSTWAEVGEGSASGGGISDNSGWSLEPSIAIALDGTLYVAWEDFSGGVIPDIYVRAWNGENWTEVGVGSAEGGGISNNSGWSQYPSLAIAPDGKPYVAWHDSTSYNDEIYVRAWNGFVWAEMGPHSASGGGISNNFGASGWASIAIAEDGMPFVAWHDDSSGDLEIYVRTWNGSRWLEVGAGSARGGGISNNTGSSVVPAIAIAPDGKPYVAWEDFTGGNQNIYMRLWNGSSWAEVGAGSASGGGISNNAGGSYYSAVAIAPDGTPYVTWEDDNSVVYDEIYIRRYTDPAFPLPSSP